MLPRAQKCRHGFVQTGSGVDVYPALHPEWRITGGAKWLPACCEKYFGRASRNANPDMASTGKAYTSIACGIMLKEFRGKIPEGLDTKVFAVKYLAGSLRT